MANPQDTSHAVPPPWVVGVAGLLSLAVAMGIGRFAFTPMLPLMVRDGQLDVAAGGWLAAANYAGYLVGALTAARTGWPPARVAVVSLVATAVLTAAMALPGPTAWWALLRLLAGIASAWAFIGTSSWCLATLARTGTSGWASALYAGVGGGIALAGLDCLAGGAAGWPVAGLWLQLAALALVLAAPALWVMARSAPAGGAAARPQPPAATPPGSWGLVVCYAVLGFGYILPATFLPVQAHTLVEDPRVFGLAWPVFGTTAAVSALVAARLLQRNSRLQVWSVSHLLMGVGVLLPSLRLSLLTVTLSALLVGGTFMVVTLAGVQEIRARAHGDATRLVGRMTAAFALGQIAGPVASALLMRVAPSRGLDLAVQLAAFSLLASGAWLWRAAARPVPTLPETSHAH
jgi:MFS family permease